MWLQLSSVGGRPPPSIVADCLPPSASRWALLPWPCFSPLCLRRTFLLDRETAVEAAALASDDGGARQPP